MATEITNTTSPQEVEQLLSHFTDPNPIRYDFDKQYAKDGWRYASDARIAVRINTGEQDFTPISDDGLPARFPKMEKIFDHHVIHFKKPENFSPLHSRKMCEACNDTGVAKTPCNICSGSGNCVCKCGDDHDCHMCDGDGFEENVCDNCKLTLKDGVYIAGQYLKKISQLAGVKMNHQFKDHCTLFTFEFCQMQCQGIVMHLNDSN